MAERSRLFEDLASVAGGAFSVLVGVRDETEAALKARLDELARRLDVATRTEVEAVKELAANARAVGEDTSQRLAAALLRLETVEKRLDAIEQKFREEPNQASRPPG